MNPQSENMEPEKFISSCCTSLAPAHGTNQRRNNLFTSFISSITKNGIERKLIYKLVNQTFAVLVQ